jgi:hypothetical protein
MKKTTIHAWLAILTGSIALAQPPRGPGGPGGPGGGGPNGPGGPPPPSALIGALDTNHDHIISAEEIAAAATSLAALDTDGDGAISHEEMRPPRPEGDPQDGDHKGNGKGKNKPHGDKPPRPPGPPNGRKMPPQPLLAALDTDKDGALSAAEIAAAPASLAKLDKNSDGQLTPDEFDPRPPHGEGPPPHGEGPPPPPEGE